MDVSGVPVPGLTVRARPASAWTDRPFGREPVDAWGVSPSTLSPQQERFMPAQCTHMDQVRDVTPRTPEGCEECLASGDRWVHLRVCLTCGHVGCCDSSKNRHARRHYHDASHPIVGSWEPGETWSYCFADDVMVPAEGPRRSA